MIRQGRERSGECENIRRHPNLSRTLTSKREAGADINLQATIRPTDHLALSPVAARSFVNVDLRDGRGSRRLFTADIARLKAVYTLTSRAFVRVIGQHIATRRDTTLYTSAVTERDGSFSASALFAYKLNWQSVLFVGYGDNRTLLEDDHYAKANRQFFLKLSYAIQK